MIVPLPNSKLHVATNLFHFVKYFLVFFDRTDTIFVAMKRPDRNIFYFWWINKWFSASVFSPLPADGAAAAKKSGSS